VNQVIKTLILRIICEQYRALHLPYDERRVNKLLVPNYEVNRVLFYNCLAELMLAPYPIIGL